MNDAEYDDLHTESLNFNSLATKKQKFEQDGLILKNEGKLSVFQKICFAVGGLPYQMCGNALGLFISPFLLEVAQIRPKQVSVILFSGRGWDAVTDPLIGFLVNRTNTRFGKLRPWIIFPVPLAIFCYIMIWYVPDISRSSKTVWYLVFYCFFQTFLSCLHVPYTSLTMYLTPDQAERDSATGYRMVFEVFGVLLAAVIQGIVISIYGSTVNCDATTLAQGTTLPFVNDSSLISNNISDNFESSENKLSEGYLLSASIMSFIYFLCCLTTFFGTKEMKDVITDHNKDFFKSFKSVFSHKSYITLLLAFLFNSLAVQLVQSNLALFCKYTVDAGDQYQYLIIVLLVSSILSLPLWQYLMIKLGKKTTYAIGLILLIPNLFILLYIENTIWLLYIVCVISGMGIAVNFLLPWSMLPDVIDEFMIKTGERKESIFYSFYVFFTKLASGVAVAASALVLEFSGYIDCPDGCCKQPSSISLALRMLIVPGPIILLLMSLIFIWKHPIDENRRKELKERLHEIRHDQVF
ncbi:sodium-dependent lysophosphatidylcholine symporter 1 [Brachionus plicatilis]|uniref:Sodium-dependent lysophosphatidylcholine symporter 1 n=1 Tax=Brachionus plicatilis TaxID=10195 RepID=A0A3M7P951_BRAPC|nr:sodium-dependent lysophosphatidylcholine symporter 1 [Brachionus plicatilis]